MNSKQGNTILFILGLSCAAALGVLVVVFGTQADMGANTLSLPPEGEALVMVWRDQGIPEAHVAVRRGGGYYLPGPAGSLVEDAPPSYWEAIR